MSQNTNTNEQQWKLLVLILKEIAKEKNISQEKIAVESGLHQSNVSRFFGLKYAPSIATFLQIAKVIKVNFFFEDQEGKSELNEAFERAMEELGRRADKLPKN